MNIESGQLVKGLSAFLYCHSVKIIVLLMQNQSIPTNSQGKNCTFGIFSVYLPIY